MFEAIRRFFTGEPLPRSASRTSSHTSMAVRRTTAATRSENSSRGTTPVPRIAEIERATREARALRRRIEREQSELASSWRSMGRQLSFDALVQMHSESRSMADAFHASLVSARNTRATYRKSIEVLKQDRRFHARRRDNSTGAGGAITPPRREPTLSQLTTSTQLSLSYSVRSFASPTHCGPLTPELASCATTSSHSAVPEVGRGDGNWRSEPPNAKRRGSSCRLADPAVEAHNAATKRGQGSCGQDGSVKVNAWPGAVEAAGTVLRPSDRVRVSNSQAAAWSW